MTGHVFTRVLKAKGMFMYCNRCGLIMLHNRATEKAIKKGCSGLRDLDDDEYLKTVGRKK